MGSSIKVRTSLRDDQATIRMIVRHPMHTGYEFDAEKEQLIPAHYIERLTVKHGETVLLDCDWSRAVSANPYLSFVFNGAKAGDMLTISWVDNLGESDEAVKELR
jgi:sulfur-oxidizing protein SoxZ